MPQDPIPEPRGTLTRGATAMVTVYGLLAVAGLVGTLVLQPAVRR